ncbi:MAG: endonuclease/exonuclease/phosphatase family protein [Planctomyces sp.]|jgi:endonuclease/exonuclease/phosphatase family metal-dependent hydrolase
MRLLSTLNSRRDALRSLLAASLAAPLASPAQAICCDERPQPDQNPASVSHQPLQILCWNIHHGRGTDELINLERQAAVINSSAADAVALQEVDQNTVRSGGADQTAVLAKLTGLHGWFAHQLDFDGGRYGQALLSRWPLEDCTVHWLPGRPDRERRIAGSAVVKHPVRTFRLITAHLHHNNEGLRLEQARELARLCQHFRETSPLPVFAAGDLYAVPGSPPLQALEKVLQSPAGNTATLATFPVTSPTRQIDYIMYAAEAGRITAERVEVLPEQVASDHRPLLARFSIR